MTTISWKSGVSGSWTNNGNWTPGLVPGPGDDVVVAAPGSYTIAAVVATSAGSLTLADGGATLMENAALTLGGTLNLLAGTFNLAGGTISGGTVALRGGAFKVGSGTLNGVTVQGVLALTSGGANLNIAGGLTTSGVGGSGAGEIDVTGASANLGFLGTQTLDGATVVLGSPSAASPARLAAREAAGIAGTLTLGPALNIVSNGGYGLLLATGASGANQLVNAGTIGLGGGGLIQISADRFDNTGTLSVAGGTLDILTGPYVLDPVETGGNSGIITISGGALIFGGSFSNTGTILATGGHITIGGNFSTSGAFRADNTVLTIGGTISGAALLAVMSNSNNTVTCNAVYDNSGTVLSIGGLSPLAGLALGAGLTISGGTVADAGGGFVFAAGTMDHVVYQGLVDLSGTGATLDVANGLVVTTGTGGSGSVLLTGASSLLSFFGNQTFDNATVTIGGPGLATLAKLQELDLAGSGATLTLGPNLLVTAASGGSGLLRAIDAAGNDGLANAGTIQVATSGALLEITANLFDNAGTLNVADGTLDVLTGGVAAPAGAQGTNEGLIRQSGGLLAFGSTFVNRGAIVVSGGTLMLTGDFTDAGTVQVDHANVSVGGVFRGTNLLRVIGNATDTVTVAGTYDNAGATIAIGSGGSLSTLSLVAGLVIAGGTIVDAGGGLAAAGGSFDAVTYVGTLGVGAGGSVHVIDALTVHSGLGGGAGRVALTGGGSALTVLGPLTLDNLTIAIGDASGVTDSLYNQSGGTLTLGSNLGLQQSIGLADIYTYAGATTINRGTIAVTGGTLQVLGDGGAFVNAGTIAISSGASFGAYAFANGSSFYNIGEMSVTAGASATLEAGWSNSGTITVTDASLQLGSDTTTAWGSVGTIIATNATLQLQGAFTTAQLGHFDLSGGTCAIVGSLDNHAALLTVGGAAPLGTLTLQGGTISGGTIADLGGGIQFASGTLDGVAYRGTMSVGGGGGVWLLNGLTLLPSSGVGAGAVNLTGGSGLFVLDAETLDNAVVTLGDASLATDFIESLNASGSGTLTLGRHLLLQQATGDVAIYTEGGGTTVNAGRIAISGGTFHLDDGTFINGGTITVAGQGAQFNDNLATFSNTGILSASGGAGIMLAAGWSNAGTISATTGALLQLGSDSTSAWGAIGTIAASGATLALYGAFTTAQLQSLQLTGDNAFVGGVWDNTGATLAIGTTTPLTSVQLVSGGVLRGGVLTDLGGALIAGGGTLDGVTYVGTLAVGAGGQLAVTGGLTMQTPIAGGSGTIALTGGGSVLSIIDTETLDHAVVLVGDGSGVTDILANAGLAATTLTLGANLVLTQAAGTAQLLGKSPTDTTINRGQILLTGGTLDIGGGTFSNLGTMSVTGGEITLDLGVFANLSGHALTGGVYVVGTGTMQLAPNIYITTLAADVTLSGTSSVLGTANSAGVEIGMEATVATIATGGALRLLAGRSATFKHNVLDQGVLQLGGGTISNSTLTTIAGTLVGFGTVAGGLADSGLIEASGGTLFLATPVVGSGTLQVDGGATLELGNTTALATQFSGAGGTLQIDRPTTFSGTLVNFSALDTLVLAGVTADAVSISGSTLSAHLTNGKTVAYALAGTPSGAVLHTAIVGGNTRITMTAPGNATLTSTLNDAGGTLWIGGVTTLTLIGGTVVGGTMIDSGGGLVVNDPGTLDGVTYQGVLAISPNGELDIRHGLVVRGAAGSAGTITLTGGGSVLSVLDTETLDNTTVRIGDNSFKSDILANGGAGNTTLTLGPNLLLQQSVGSASLTATSVTDLTINRGHILVTGGSLDIGGGLFTNAGTIGVSGGGAIRFAASTLTNFASGTLTGGVYVVGDATTLELAKSNFISTLAADVTLIGASATIETLNSIGGEVSLDRTIRSITASGALRLLGGRSLALKAAMLVQGLLQIDGGTLSDDTSTTIAGTLFGRGMIAGHLADTGLIEANGGRLCIQSAVTGAGALRIDAGATLELATTATQTVTFGGAAATLLLDKPGTFAGTIAGFAVGETIVLGGVTATASLATNVVSVSLGNGKTVNYAVAGDFTGLALQTRTVAGGTELVLMSSGPQATIQVSTLSLPAAGFVDPSRLTAGAVVATAGGQTLNVAAAPSLITGSADALRGDHILGFAAGDLIDVTDLAFRTAAATLAGGGRLQLGDGVRATDVTLLGPIAGADLLLLADGHGGTVIAHAIHAA